MYRRLVASLSVLIIAACGGGGGGGSTPEPVGNVSIVTSSLERGNVGHTFGQQLTATGGQAPYSWRVSGSGDPLPAGLTLQTNGQLVGTPSIPALRTVVVIVEGNDASLDVRSLQLEVRDVEIDAPGASLAPGAQFAFQATGGSATYTFELMANMSGAALTTQGDYTAGGGSGVDVVRATDADGFFDEVSVTVGDDPFVGFQPVWGASDVWFVDWDVIYDPNPNYATDFDEVLVALGLRDAASTGTTGTQADELARRLVIRRALGHLSRYYGNDDNGNLLPGGLSISFVGPDGPSTGTTPSVGGVQSGAPFRYNTICVRHGPTGGVVGTAWLDPTNNSVEHNCGDPSSTALGVFANRLLAPYLQAFNNSLQSSPVTDADIARLERLLAGETPTGGRETAIHDVANNFGRVIAAVLAHEIGHSLGLNHSNPSDGSGDIMNASLSISTTVFYAFNAGHRSTLQANLPGAGR